MSEAVLGTTVPTITVSLIRNSRQRFALRWTPPEGETLDLSDTTITLEIFTRPVDISIPAGTVKEDGVETWLTVWDLSHADADWDFTLADGAIVQWVGVHRTVLMHARVEVQ